MVTFICPRLKSSYKFWFSHKLFYVPLPHTTIPKLCSMIIRIVKRISFCFPLFVVVDFVTPLRITFNFMNYWKYIFLFLCFLPRRIIINRWTRKVDFISNITIYLFCVKPETPCRWWLWTFPYNYIIRHFVSWMPPPTKKRLWMKNKWGNIWISPPSNKIWIGGFQAAAGVINHPWKTNCSNNQNTYNFSHSKQICKSSLSQKERAIMHNRTIMLGRMNYFSLLC